MRLTPFAFLFPAGDYLNFSIRLRSNIRLYLDAGATIVAASPEEHDGGYDLADPNPWHHEHGYQDYGHSHWKDSLIWGIGLENVTIEGPGTIFGKGLVKWDTEEPGYGNKAIPLKECRNVTLRDFTIRQGGHFGILPTAVDDFLIDGLTIDTNRDAINIDACKNVRISNCTLNSPNDDAIVLKSSYALGRSAHHRECHHHQLPALRFRRRHAAPGKASAKISSASKGRGSSFPSGSRRIRDSWSGIGKGWRGESVAFRNGLSNRREQMLFGYRRHQRVRADPVWLPHQRVRADPVWLPPARAGPRSKCSQNSPAFRWSTSNSGLPFGFVRELRLGDRKESNPGHPSDSLQEHHLGKCCRFRCLDYHCRHCSKSSPLAAPPSPEIHKSKAGGSP